MVEQNPDDQFYALIIISPCFQAPVFLFSLQGRDVLNKKIKLPFIALFSDLYDTPGKYQH